MNYTTCEQNNASWYTVKMVQEQFGEHKKVQGVGGALFSYYLDVLDHR